MYVFFFVFALTSELMSAQQLLCIVRIFSNSIIVNLVNLLTGARRHTWNAMINMYILQIFQSTGSLLSNTSILF